MYFWGTRLYGLHYTLFVWGHIYEGRITHCMSGEQVYRGAVHVVFLGTRLLGTQYMLYAWGHI